MDTANSEHLPELAELLDGDLIKRFGHIRVVRTAKAVLDAAKAERAAGTYISSELLLLRLTEQLNDGLRPVMNGTGVLLHPKLGSAPWSGAAIQSAVLAAGYSSVPAVLTNQHSYARSSSVEDRLCSLFGAQSALVVNNATAAIMLMLTAFAREKTVLVGRGEMKALSGGFDVSELTTAANAVVCEVGTMDRTQIHDFEECLGDDVAAILRVHHSRFQGQLDGTQPTLEQLASLSRPLWVDLGNGVLDPRDESASAKAAIDAGAQLVCLGGDALLGGPKLGLILGDSACIETLRAHPMYRALLPDKVLLAAMEGTLDDWLRGHDVPLVSMRKASLEVLKAHAEDWYDQLHTLVECRVVQIEESGVDPETQSRFWPSFGLALRHERLNEFIDALKKTVPPVLGRRVGDEWIVDARTIIPLGTEHAMLLAVEKALDTVDEG